MNPASVTFTVFLGLLAALPALSIDVSAPTLALLPDALATTKVVAGLTLSLFMAGFALGQFAGGSLSDRHGRKPILVAGLLIYGIAGIGCALSQTGPNLVAARCIQGLGAGTCSVLSFAMVQDLFRGETARSKRAYVTAIFGGVPMVAPALGAVVNDYLGWRAVYVVLACGGGVLLAVTGASLAESRPPRRPASPEILEIAPAKLWNDHRFIGLALANALSYGAAFAYVAGSPILVVTYYGGSIHIFAAVFACTAAALAAGAWTCGQLSRRGTGSEVLLSVALGISAAACLGIATVGVAGPGRVGLAAIPLLMAVTFARGIIAPNLQHLAISQQADRAGSASAAVGLMQLAFGSLSSAAVAGLLTSAGPFAVALPMVVLSVAAWLVWRRLSRAGPALALTGPSLTGD